MKALKGRKPHYERDCVGVHFFPHCKGSMPVRIIFFFEEFFIPVR